ncbi:hypothetical protein Har1130_13940 [Haloarcula sp. CBA1130]|uniref:hypothetical protein n=1 Tax=unclassified Haloarcula TaxID=2624677 RepID=UPI0012443CBC|nr:MULTISPECIES: hypothetical protein [unclassified Haloarcula]KAA9399282.1 hypothetical protein Har1129_14040 [Haloarcula sp. CBA1129]KAA9403795.1 hypothetical protein Har1130_13940 [Haloarcula sp. CBA1130]
MKLQRTERRRASERARRVETTVDRTTGGAAYPVRVAELADEYGSAAPPAEGLSTAIDHSARPETMFDDREQS